MKLEQGKNDKLIKWQNDDMASTQNGNLMTWYDDEVASSLKFKSKNCCLIKHQVYEMAH